MLSHSLSTLNQRQVRTIINTNLPDPPNRRICVSRHGGMVWEEYSAMNSFFPCGHEYLPFACFPYPRRERIEQINDLAVAKAIRGFHKTVQDSDYLKRSGTIKLIKQLSDAQMQILGQC